MPIQFNQKKKQFHLYNDTLSYIMELDQDKYLTHLYYGERIRNFTMQRPYPEIDRSSFSPNPENPSTRGFSLDVILQEMPGQDSGDYREPAFEIIYPDGTSATHFAYKSHRTFAGKKALPGLPATYVKTDSEAETLEITLIDSIRQVEAVLSYTIFEKLSVITKSISFKNTGTKAVTLLRAFSSCFEFPDADFDCIQLPGAWAREKQLVRHPIHHGFHVLDSKRGASGVAQQPFMALARKGTDENTGEVYGLHFVYSGNFSIRTQVDTYSQTRVLVGLNPYHFSWKLGPGESFQTPEVVSVYAKNGLNEMSHNYHSLYINHLARGEHQYKERPVLINNWESTYFDFNETKLLQLAKRAKDIGVELLVLDDGWFGHRDDDTTSLGDWTVDKRKLPNGLNHLANEVNKLGLKFGLWFEPEMVSKDSSLYREHPDWHIHVDKYPLSVGRNQYVLDFSREDVREGIYQQLTKILDATPIDYIKWDMNRNITELGNRILPADQQMEISHRYILGLYELLEKLTTRYPHILFENCSGGGGRFDPGMTYYMPQSWASDNTDGYDRIKIQYGTSLIFPPVMICAQLSEAPNHQVGRTTPLATRANVAMSANFGVMLDLEKESKETLDYTKHAITWYKEHRRLLQFGTFYRLENPFTSNFASWSFIAPNQEEAVVFFFKALGSASEPLVKLHLQGLNPDYYYQCDQKVYSGEELMKFGLYLNEDLHGDFLSQVFHFTKIDQP
ncbi:alpha-galactosidase [Listeria grayi]|uniref:alpha-galactosidase n=1 Tax=Listeria grayi TaxID=1641 RepID=UPI0016231D03|nr:alpha-galactosidase [Listeria grayi]MBC1922564.1 alpha-galactosidase [Listeria grayi]